jgi:hypothetical protein
MKIDTDPMPLLRIAARDRVDLWFNDVAGRALHRDAAHVAKRAAAQRIVAGETLTALDEEAALRGLSSADLARLILSKPDEIMDREVGRQRVFAAIAQAATPAALDDIVKNLSSMP